MPKVKTLLVVLLVIAFSFTLIGCGLITSRTTSTDEVVEMGGQIPEWLLLSHRSIASEASDIDDDLADIDEGDEEEEAVDGVDDGVTADSSQTAQATSEVAQAAETGSTQQQQTTQEKEPEQPKPGSREYMAWFAANRAQGEYDPIYLRWYADPNRGNQSFDNWLKEQIDKENDNDGIFDNWDQSPSGWGHTTSSQ